MNEKQRMWKLAGRYSTVGIEMVAAVGIGVYAGSWADERWSIEPIGVTIGAFVGLGAAIKAIMRIIKQAKRDKL